MAEPRSVCAVCRVPLDPKWDEYVKGYLHTCPRCGRRYSAGFLRQAKKDVQFAMRLRAWGVERARAEGR